MKPCWPPYLVGWALMVAVTLAVDLVPRMTFWMGDSSRLITSFSRKWIFNYDTFLLNEDEETLYVGARDTILALDISEPNYVRLMGEISWSPTPSKRDECVFKKKSNETECFNFIRVLVQLNETHLYTCGTYAFSPTCAYIDLDNFSLVTEPNGQVLLQEGKGLCPFDPQHQNTAILVDGELYTGTMNNFHGNEPIISRTLGSRTVLKTDNFLNWLQDAEFVSSFHVPSPPDDDKVYFFFEETAKEFDFFEKLTVSRVARVCKNDIGGDKVLQKKWTTFLKAQLSCTEPGQFPYTVVQHVFALPQPAGNVIFYGVFASQWQVGNLGSSAICAFTLKSIKKVFNGKYKELNKDCSRWMTYSGPAMDPRPGSCSVGPSSDKALTFMKEHFLMDERVTPTNDRPLLVKHNVKYTRIAVHQTWDVLGVPYNVMFMGTDKGFLHKAVVVSSGVHIIEEIQLFEEPEAVQNLLLYAYKGILYVGYSKGVLQIPLANCSVYATCGDCILARDPYCAWDGHKCQDIRKGRANISTWLQDIEMGRPGPGCQRNIGKARSSPKSKNDSEGGLLKVLGSSANSILRLPCPQASALANYSWSYPEGDNGLVIGEDKTLLVVVHKETQGPYECWASENGYRHPVVRYLISFGQPNRAGTPEKGLEHRVLPVDQRRSYWAQFVTVSVLLAMSLAVAFALASFSYHDRVKARAKVQGCSPSNISSQEKAPLNGSQDMPAHSMEGPSAQEPAMDSPKPCCVHVEGDVRVVDMDRNWLNSGLAKGEEARGATTVVGI